MFTDWRSRLDFISLKKSTWHQLHINWNTIQHTPPAQDDLCRSHHSDCHFLVMVIQEPNHRLSRASVFKDNLSWHTQQISSLKTGHAIRGPSKARRWKSIAFQRPCCELIPCALMPNIHDRPISSLLL